MLRVGRLLVDGNQVRPRTVTTSNGDKMIINPCSFFSLLCNCMAGKDGVENTLHAIATIYNSRKI